MTTPLHLIQVVLGLPKPTAAIIVRLTAILDAMTANSSTFPTPPIALATVKVHVAALSSAEAAMKSRTVGNKAARDDAKALVIADAKQLHAYVQQLANASPSQAATIAADAAMKLHKAGAHPKADVTVKQKVSGAVHVSARSVKGAKSHEWQLSSDGGKSWTTLSPTTQASTTITGITPGTLVQVRHRIVVKGGPGDWVTSSPVAVS
jgi:hypothetical protein